MLYERDDEVKQRFEELLDEKRGLAGVGGARMLGAAVSAFFIFFGTLFFLVQLGDDKSRAVTESRTVSPNGSTTININIGD